MLILTFTSFLQEGNIFSVIEVLIKFGSPVALLALLWQIAKYFLDRQYKRKDQQKEENKIILNEILNLSHSLTGFIQSQMHEIELYSTNEKNIRIKLNELFNKGDFKIESTNFDIDQFRNYIKENQDQFEGDNKEKLLVKMANLTVDSENIAKERQDIINQIHLRLLEDKLIFQSINILRILNVENLELQIKNIVEKLRQIEIDKIANPKNSLSLNSLSGIYEAAHVIKLSTSSLLKKN